MANTTIEALKKKHNKSKNVRKALNVLAFGGCPGCPDGCWGRFEGDPGGVDAPGHFHHRWW